MAPKLYIPLCFTKHKQDLPVLKVNNHKKKSDHSSQSYRQQWRPHSGHESRINREIRVHKFCKYLGATLQLLTPEGQHEKKFHTEDRHTSFITKILLTLGDLVHPCNKSLLSTESNRFQSHFNMYVSFVRHPWGPTTCLISVPESASEQADKRIPLLDRPCGFQEVEAPKFQDNRHMKLVGLSVLHTGRLYPQEIIKYITFSWQFAVNTVDRKENTLKTLRLRTLPNIYGTVAMDTKAMCNYWDKSSCKLFNYSQPF